MKIEKWDLPDDLHYDRKEHLWVKMEENKARVGMDDLGQDMAGKVIKLRMFPAGKDIEKGKPFGSLESGKYVGPVKAPVSGKILEANQKVIDNPRTINEDSYGEGWLILIEATNLEGDMSDLVHGAEIESWMNSEIAAYREKGVIKD